MHEVIDRIKKASSVAVFPHVNEDPDALCSCFAFTDVLRKMGKKAVCYTNDTIEKHLNFIGGEYVVYDSEKTYDYDLVLCLDCGDIDRLGERKKLFDEIGNSVNIDHHLTNTRFADVNYVDGGASATAEILCELFSKMGEKLDDKIARFLYIAICSDTGCFKYSNVSPKTMRIAADLLEFDFDHSQIARLLFDTSDLNVMKLKSELMQNVHSYADGKVSVVLVDDDVYRKYRVEPKEAQNIVDIPRCVAGTEIAVCVKRQNGEIRVSLRSNGYANVSEVSMKFGGGGHAKAAGCSVDVSTVEEAEKLIVEECIRAL